MADDTKPQALPPSSADGEAAARFWPGMESTTKVQELLDQNKLLVAEINHNHQLRTPDALQRNVVLIRQLNGNISEVVRLYQDLASMVGEGEANVDQGGAQQQAGEEGRRGEGATQPTTSVGA